MFFFIIQSEYRLSILITFFVGLLDYNCCEIYLQFTSEFYVLTMYPVDNRNIWINNHVNNRNYGYDYKRKKLKKVIKDLVYVSTLNLIINLLAII